MRTTNNIKHAFASDQTMNRSIMRLFSSIRPWAAAALLAGAALASPAAEDSATSGEGKRYVPWEKGSVKFGGFVAAFESNLGFGVNNAAGVTFNAEEVFNLDSSLLVLRAEAMYRPGKSLRH
jgi:hypothetical protein